MITAIVATMLKAYSLTKLRFSSSPYTILSASIRARTPLLAVQREIRRPRMNAKPN